MNPKEGCVVCVNTRSATSYSYQQPAASSEKERSSQRGKQMSAWAHKLAMLSKHGQDELGSDDPRQQMVLRSLQRIRQPPHHRPSLRCRRRIGPKRQRLQRHRRRVMRAVRKSRQRRRGLDAGHGVAPQRGVVETRVQRRRRPAPLCIEKNNE